jgi:hypothetical protein
MPDFQIIKVPEIIPIFLDMCPEFQPQWDEHVKYWGDNDRGEYIDIAEFARFVVDCYANGQRERFPQVFQAVEALLKNGHPKIKELVTIGLLEDIQTIATHHEFGPDVFLNWLGPLSREAWFRVSKAWEGKSSLMDVVREENRSKGAEN